MWGKIIGGVVGTVFGLGWIGIGAGIAVGHLFDLNNRKNDSSGSNDSNNDESIMPKDEFDQVKFDRTKRANKESGEEQFKNIVISEYQRRLERHLAQSFSNGDDSCGVSLVSDLYIPRDYELYTNLCTIYRCDSYRLEKDPEFVKMVIASMKEIGQRHDVHGSIEVNEGVLHVRWRGQSFRAKDNF